MLNILVTGCRDLLDEGGISECYPSIKPFQWGVDDLQAAVTALQMQSVHGCPCIICSVVESSFLILQNIFAGQREKNHIKHCKSQSVLLNVAKCIRNNPHLSFLPSHCEFII